MLKPALVTILVLYASMASAQLTFNVTTDEPALAVSAGDAAPTPLAEVVRVLGLLPKPESGFVDYGCGPTARWCIAAAEKWGCKVTGVELDPIRAAAARRHVHEAGLDHLVTIVQGDAIDTDVKADVGVAYLYADTLRQLKPRLEKLRAFASYFHEPPGLATVRNGDSWIYTKPAKSEQPRGAVWNGQVYAQPVCNNPNCGMCNAIRAQLATNAAPQAAAAKAGHWETRVLCNGRHCQRVNVWVN